MLFNSYEFILIYLPIVLFCYYRLAKLDVKYAKYFLVFASIVFYSYWDINNLPILLFSIIINYFIGYKLSVTHNKKWLILGVIFNLAYLCFYKYTNFIIDNINYFFDGNINLVDIALPLGISFFTFTQMAYLVDVYKRETDEYTKSDYLLFVTIFPHLIAGPILYHKDMIPQFKNISNYIVNYKNLTLGLIWFIIGLFKKVVIADRLAIIANMVFDNPQNLTFFDAWGGSIAYTLQLYFDFSGYSEMAIGLGLMLNYNLPRNFFMPYRACSIIDFWRRWHITLSMFLKNYLYIPIGGNRNGKHLRNIMITMLLGGLWHGAGWTYVLWGGIHGAFISVNHIWRKTKFHFPKIINWSVTFLSVNFAWVFFRAENIENALNIIYVMFDFSNIALPPTKILIKYFGEILPISLNYIVGFNELLEILFILVFILNFDSDFFINKFKLELKYLIIYSLILTYVLIIMHKVVAQFIYFQF